MSKMQIQREPERLRRPGRRFTLVELMVALALALIISAVAVTAFTQTAGVGSMAHARIDAMHNARSALRMIDHDLRAAYIEPDGHFFTGETDYIEMLTVSGQGGVSGPARVRYDSVDGGGYGHVLFRSVRPARHKESPAVPLIESSSAGSFTVTNDFTHYFPAGSRTAIIQSAENDGLYRVLDARYDATENHTEIDVDGEVIDASDDGYLLTGDAVAFNVTDFTLRFYHGNSAIGLVDVWDSTDDTAETYRRLPQVVEVMIETVDDKGVLRRDDNQPVSIRRLINIGAGMTR